MVAVPKRLSLPAGLRNSRRQESDMARMTGGALTRGSGNQAEKGDVRVRGAWRIECKATSAKSYSITLDTWARIAQAAMLAGEEPLLAIRFTGGNGAPLCDLAVVPLQRFLEAGDGRDPR